MQFQDKRLPVVWEQGDLVVCTTERRYLIMKISDNGLGTPMFAMMETTTSATVMTRASLVELKDAFSLLYEVTEVIKAGDLMIVAIND